MATASYSQIDLPSSSYSQTSDTTCQYTFTTIVLTTFLVIFILGDVFEL